MRTAVKQVEVLARRILDEARKAVDVPVVHDILDCFPGGRFIRTVIEHREPPPVKFEPKPIAYTPPRVPVASRIVTATDPVQAVLNAPVRCLPVHGGLHVLGLAKGGIFRQQPYTHAAPRIVRPATCP